MKLLRKLKIKDKILGLIIPVIVLVSWEIVARLEIFPSQLLVPPKLVLQAFIDLAGNGELLDHLKISFARVFSGFLLGSLLGFLLGAAMGLSKTVEGLLGPLFHSIRQVPLYGWMPLLMLWLGIGEDFKVVFIAVAPFYVMALYTLEGINGVPREYVEVGRVFEYGKLRLLWKFILPSALPSIATGLRLSLSFSWMAVIGAELLAANVGIGYMMTWARQLFQIDIVMLGIITVGVIGFIMDYLAGLFEAYFLRWRRTYNS